MREEELIDSMSSPIFQLLQGLKGVLYGERVKLDLQETALELREYLAPVLTEEADAGLVAWKLYQFFLPSTVIDEIENMGDVCQTIEEPVIAVVEPLLSGLKGDPRILELRAITTRPY